MAKTKVEIKDKIKIFDPSSLIGVYDPVGAIEKKFDFYIKFVIGILVVAVITMLLMSVQIVVEAFRFNSSVYKEQQMIQDQEKVIRNTASQQEAISELLKSIDKRLGNLESK